MNFIVFVSILIAIAAQISEAFGNNLPTKECDDGWTPYKDEKCLKVFDTDAKSYNDAERFCKTDYNAHLVTIDVPDKQRFVQSLLKPKFSDKSIWIGLKNLGDEKYAWSDGTLFSFANWDANRMVKDEKLCFQMYAEDSQSPASGKWDQKPCSDMNLVVCEKMQPWTMEQLQIKMMNSMRTTVPVNFIYLQLPKSPSPDVLWPYFGWKDISREYDSLFFRVLGKNSGKFNEVQESDNKSPTLVVRMGKKNLTEIPPYEDTIYVVDVPMDDWSPEIYYQPYGKEQHFSQLKTNSKEVIPRNTAIKVWKRIY